MKIVSSLKNKVLGFFNNRFTSRSQFKGDSNLLDENYPVEKSQAPNAITNHLLHHAYLSNAESLLELSSDITGLTPFEVEQKLAEYGYNEIDKQEKLSWYYHLWLSYKNPFNLLLTILATVSFLTDDTTGAVVIGFMVLISTVLRFVQERRSNNAADKLKEMVSTTATVIRQEIEDEEDDDTIAALEKQIAATNPAKIENHNEIPIKLLVPGDVIRLSAGDMIPSDVRILTAKDLFVSQAALTGESLPVEKYAEQKEANVKEALELQNIGFMGSNVVSGSALAVVLSTGSKTFFGALADKVIAEDVSETAFQKGVNRVSWLLIYFMLIMSPIVFLINGLTTHAWRDAALFALSVAVGLTPEMLPMIVTSTLAKGAVFMSRRKVIVKRLDAIQNFGAMNILCTDKTGTLTQDKICLEKHTDIFGNEYDDVLEYAYLNSYYQTGLKNLLDVAVLEHGNFGDIPDLVKKFHKVDEVPFDFQRRRMSVVVADENADVLICKGAVEEMLSCCKYAEHDGQVMPLTEELLERLLSVTADLNSDGLRVVAVAKKNYPIDKKNYSISDEKEMTLIGYVAFLDPPKETTQPAIEALNKLGIEVKILTGDNDLVTAKVCREVGLNVEGMLLGSDVDRYSDEELSVIAKNTTVFAKLTPAHKERIVTILREAGNVVGFMGDGINDAPALRAADIGISVDTAVDISKEAADIILLEKSLMVLEQGVEEGRKTFANMLKYIKITASSNFGNVFSVLIASAFIPFLPMLPVQLLLQNLIYDVSQTVIPFDNVDEDFIEKPQRWDPDSLRRFMIFFGPISSIFDVLTFFVMWHVFGANSPAHQTLFQSGWFVEGLLTQTLIVHMIRTKKIPFIQSTAGWPMLVMTTCAVSLGIFLPMSPVAHLLGMQALPPMYFVFLLIVIVSYMILTQSLKGFYSKRFGWQ
ncbi:MAG: magnesium-translocating P-type ATPase [Neisseriaceae bacterium]|nr:MAG: magnesium-translocating P-type ATPase [Neisseriaceae bacterium]